METPTTSRIVVAAILTSYVGQVCAFMTQEIKDQIASEVEAVRIQVDGQHEASAKQRVLATAFATTTDPYVKKELLAMAIAIGAPELESFLLGILQNEQAVRLRILAVEALAKYGSPEAVQPLLDCARKDPEGQGGWDCIRYQTTARRDAYFALVEIGLRYPAARQAIAKSIAAFPVTADYLHDPKIQALYILTQDKTLLKSFFERLRHKDPKVREKGVVAFGLLKLTNAPDELVRLLDDPTQGVRSWVALVLGEIADSNTIPMLIAKAGDRQEGRAVRCNAISSLGRMRAKQAESLLRELLTDKDVNVNAAIALSRITGQRHPIVPEGYKLD